MKWKTLCEASLLAVLNISILAAHADTETESAMIEKNMKPDIKKVLSIVKSDDGGCGIIDARMTYLDSKDNQQVMNYRIFAECHNHGG